MHGAPPLWLLLPLRIRGLRMARRHHRATPGRTCHRHAARLAYPVSQCLEKRKSVFWPIASFRKVSQSNRLILG